MTLLNYPWMVQVAWEDAATWSPWEGANANSLMSCLQGIEIDRWSFRGSLRANTCRITADDTGFDVRPGKLSSALSPNVLLGRRVRVLAQRALGSSVWHAWFFGYITDYQPDASDPQPASATITVESPLSVVADLSITLPVSKGFVVYDASDPDHSGLVLLLKAANLYGTSFVSLDDVGAVTLPDDWAGAGTTADPTTGTTKTFSAWLSDLCAVSNCVVADEPHYATSASDPDWVLRWYRPTPVAAADWNWSAANSELEPAPQIMFNGELPPL